MTLSQIASGPLVDSILTRTAFVGITALVAMVVLRFRAPREYDDRIWAALGSVAIVFFLLSAGSFSFSWPWPGALLDLALSFAEVMLGVFVGWLVFAPQPHDEQVPTKGSLDE